MPGWKEISKMGGTIDRLREINSKRGLKSYKMNKSKLEAILASKYGKRLEPIKGERDKFREPPKTDFYVTGNGKLTGADGNGGRGKTGSKWS